MRIDVSSHPARRWSVLALIALLGLAVTFISSSASSASPGHAMAAKKKCKKKHKSAATAKKKCKKKHAVVPPVTPPSPPSNPTPLALTAPEVINRITEKANEYCAEDPDCVDYGYYWDSNPSEPYCLEISTYSWTCDGYNIEDSDFDPPNAECEFSEVVERDGYNGIKSHLNTDFGGTDGWAPGWYCYAVV
jgi:hypothetical protein